MAINPIESDNSSRDIWVIMGSWLLMIGFFLSDNYIFSFLDLDEFEIRSLAALAIFLTATFCYIYSIMHSQKQLTSQEE